MHSSADERKLLELLCRHFICLALANGRAQCNAAGQVVRKLKTVSRDATSQIVEQPTSRHRRPSRKS